MLVRSTNSGISYISEATRRNWNKLHSDENMKLVSGANKRMSSKSILPIEYFRNQNNISIIQQFVDVVRRENWLITDVLYSIAINLLDKKDLIKKQHVQNVLASIHADVIDYVLNYHFPEDESDILGLVYQSLMLEGEKNKKGSYYTPSSITSEMTKDLDFSNGQLFYDPCCGSGAFLLSLDNVNPNDIYGSDNDPIAVMLAKVNLLLKFDKYEFEPKIFQLDYLDSDVFTAKNEANSIRFSYIISNPPWGAMVGNTELSSIISSKESFSYFFVKAFNQICENGIVRFLLPQSVLNVKCHKDLRKFILRNGCLKEISLYSGTFTGVMTKYVDICLAKQSKGSDVLVKEGGKTRKVKLSSFYETDGYVFNLLSDDDVDIINKVKSKGVCSLRGSSWALGIVTGDNKNKLKKQQDNDTEPIFTGKEIEQYRLKQPQNYIKYARDEFQQVAKDEYYRASEKLVYKFISKRLVFAYDDSQRLFLNSANILIPNVDGMSIKSVMALLNSDLYQYLYMSMYGELKVLKGNLEELPFPMLTKEQDIVLSSMVTDVLSGDDSIKDSIQKYVYDLFNITDKQIERIKNKIYGKVN